MDRAVARLGQTAIDLTVLSIAFWAAFAARFEGVVPFQEFKRLVFAWPYAVAFQFFLLVAFGVTRFAWRYVGLREAARILMATGLAAVAFAVLRWISILTMDRFVYAPYVLIPLGVILIDFAFAFLGIVGVRSIRRVLAERHERGTHRNGKTQSVPTLLIGAGNAGLLVAKEIASRPDMGIHAVGFVDDDPVKVGAVVHGITVLGTTAKLAEIYERHGAQQALITIASAPGKEIRRITQLCEQAGIPTKIIPGVYEIVGGQVSLSRIRNVAIEDLLGRDPVALDEDAIAQVVRGRTVLVTGAGGSIGSELCRQACRFGPASLVLVERAENNLFHVHRELAEQFPGLKIVPALGDVCDVGRMEQIFLEQKPEVVFHAAAHKHVPMLEWNPAEGVKNNVAGTRVVADLANAHRVAEFVFISTDKAVRPSSVMGMTKRVAESYVQALSQRSQTRFVAVRFGNVLGSAGSVIPTFKEQIAKGGPVTVTHPEMKRYFMTIPEACQLVLQAASMGKGGEIFILDMGEPVKIVDVARDLIRLSGLKPDEDVEIRFTGMRPGEKLFEELSTADEHADKTRHPKIFVGRIQPHPWDQVARKLDDLVAVAKGVDAALVRAKLGELVPDNVLREAKPQGGPESDRGLAEVIALPR